MMHAATLLFLLSVISGTSHANPSWQNLKETVLQADLKAKRKGQLNLAKQAIKLADECVTTNPQEVACYYYRGQATGLYYEVVMFGYQKGVVAMIADWQKAVELDPTFDHGGPYRLMGEAEDYLRKAIEIDPNYPTNHFDLAELLIKAKRKPEALEAFEKAQNLTAQWNSDPYFASWQEESKEIEEQLKGEMYGKHQ